MGRAKKHKQNRNDEALEQQENEPTGEALPTRIVHPVGVLLFMFLFIMWVLPLFYVGWNKGDFYLYDHLIENPITGRAFEEQGRALYYNYHQKSDWYKGTHNYLNNLWRCACLFTNRVNRWENYYYQVQVEGSDKWITLDESNYARLKPFGYRTRLTRVMSSIQGGRYPKIRDRLADFIKRRYARVHPDQPPVVALRVKYAVYRVGDEVLLNPKGPWEIPPLEEVEESRLYQLDDVYIYADHES